MKLTELYSEYLANWVSGGNLISKDNISLLGIRALFDRFVTHDYITKVWAIRSIPVRFDKNLTDLIRCEMFKTHPTVKTSIHYYSVPCNVSVRNNLFMMQFENISSKYNKMRDYFDMLTDDQKLAGVTDINPKTGRKIRFTTDDMKKIQEEYDSYMYVYEQGSTNHSFSSTFYFIQASCKDKKEIRRYRKSLEGMLNQNNVYYVELHGNTNAYLNNFCPATFIHRGVGNFAHILTTDQNLTGFSPYKSRGMVSGHGLLMGLDIQTGVPFWLDMFNSGSAQVNLILGKTGCGKTYFAFALALGLAAVKVHFSAIDIKGGEWTKIKKYVRGMLEINMGGADSCFVNTMRLDDVQCKTSEDAKEAFDTAVRGTVGTFEVTTALTPEEGNPADLHLLLNKAVMKVMNKHGVNPENVSTFKRTSDLKYSDVLDVLQNLMTSSTYTEDQKKICQLAITRGSDYFMSEGRYARAMSGELTLQDIYDSPAVIYNFNKNKNVMLDTLDSLRVYWVQFLDGKKQSERKKMKMHTAAFYEELQRCEQFGMLVEEIAHKVTGSRSNNVVIFLLLNSINTFNSESFAPIKSNVTSKIIGKLNKEDISQVVKLFDCAPIEEYMKRICTDKTSRLSNCFAIQYDTGVDTDTVMCKTVMSEEMRRHFNTRDRMDE